MIFNYKFDDKDLIINSSYYKWLLKADLKDVHAINTKLEYLQTLGFKKYAHKLTKEAHQHLTYVEQAFFQWEIKPKLHTLNKTV